jgi:hypothetical protein
MASPRQIAANHRNAAKSSGPRSNAGKTRASRNAQSHGLFSSFSRASLSGEITALARRIAGRASGEIALEHSRSAAEAEIVLRRIRDVKRALIDRAATFGSLETPRFFQSDLDEELWLLAGIEPEGLSPQPQDFLSTMPQDEPERSYEAMRRLLPELTKLARYEQRARGRRDRAIRKLMKLT